MVASHHLIAAPANSCITFSPPRTLPPSMARMSLCLVPAPVVRIIFLSLLPGRPAGVSRGQAAAPRHLVHNMTLALLGTFHEVSFESLTLSVHLDDLLRRGPALHLHIHQLIVEAVSLVETLAKFHELKVLRFDPLQVC